MSLADDSSKVIVNQIDLLSGSLAIAVILGTLLQIMPTPASLCLPRLRHFLDWLHKVSERDFAVKIYTCTGKCQTCVYKPNLESIKKRIRAALRLSNIDCCTGRKLITAKDLAEILQQEDNAAAFLELVKLTHYPGIQSLQNVIRVMHCLSRIHSTIVSFQWIGVAFYFSFGWLLRWGLPRWLTVTWEVILAIILRHRPGRMAHSSNGYQMAELSKHRLFSRHVPYIRYAILDILYQQLGRSLSLHNGQIWDKFALPSSGSQEFKIVSALTADECSTARTFFAISLHSMRMLLLCKHVSFIAPYMLSSSFGYVEVKIPNSSQLRVWHPPMGALFSGIFTRVKSEKAGHLDVLDSLSYMFSSPLGKTVTEDCLINIHLNVAATIVIIPDEITETPSEATPQLCERTANDGPEEVTAIYTNRQQKQNSDLPHSGDISNNSKCGTGFKVDGVEIPNELARILYESNIETVNWLVDYLEGNLYSVNLLWSPVIWFRALYSNIYSQYCLDSSECLELQTLLVRICAVPIYPTTNYIPYMDEYNNSCDNGMSTNLYQFLCSNPFPENSLSFHCPQSWCVCSNNHCRGFCTLLVDMFELSIKKDMYFELPYIFRRPLFEFVERAECDSTKHIPCPFVVQIADTVEQLQDIGLKSVTNLESTGDSALSLSNNLYSKENHLVVVYGGEILVSDNEITNGVLEKVACLEEKDEILVYSISGYEEREKVSSNLWEEYSKSKWKSVKVHRTTEKIEVPKRFFGKYKNIKSGMIFPFYV